MMQKLQTTSWPMLLSSLSLAWLLSACSPAPKPPAPVPPPPPEFTSITAYPEKLELKAGDAVHHLVLTGASTNGFDVDVTSRAKFTSTKPDVASVDEHGRVKPIQAGEALIKMSAGGVTTGVPVVVEAVTNELALSFARDVLPVMTKSGCSLGGCHAKPEGQNGFKMSVFAYDPKADHHEIVFEERGRRVFPAFPEESLLLKKATLQVDHEGGQRFTPDSAEYQLIAKWIKQGMVYEHADEPALIGVKVHPPERRYRKEANQSLLVLAQYSDGSTRDVTALAEYDSNDKEMATVDHHGQVTVGKTAGEGVIIARFMGLVDIARITVPSDRLLPDKIYADLPVNNDIDRLVYERLKKMGYAPSARCTDEEFIRRASLDSIGRLPTPDEVKNFLADKASDKRSKFIDHLLADKSFGDHWATKWTDLVRPNPDRVGVKSVYLLDQWVRESFRSNKPYDQFVREIVTAEGSTHKDAPTVIYRDRREPADLTTMFSQIFLGVRLECAKCHQHPNEKWSMDDFYQFAAYFGPLKRKGAGLSPPISAGTEYFYFASDGGTVKNPVTGKTMKPRPPEGMEPKLAENQDPRLALADWMTDAENPFFAKAVANRIWGEFFGRGIVHPVDDFRASNPPTNPALLDALGKELVKHHYDLKALMRFIMNSHVYQLSSAPNEYNLADTKNFSRSYRRRLPAEVLLDAVVEVTGVRDNYTGMPIGAFAKQAWTYKIDSPFMDAFSRPNSSSDCPCERDASTSVVQSLHMMNSKGLQAKLSAKEGRVKQLVDSKKSPEETVTDLYLAALSRYPTDEEKAIATKAFTGEGVTPQTAAEDVLWALLNSAEFVFNH
jgi:hypothetical protein